MGDPQGRGRLDDAGLSAAAGAVSAGSGGAHGLDGWQHDPRPRGASIVPGGAEMQFQFRDADPDLLAKLEGVLTEVVAEENANGPCPVTLTAQTRGMPARMDSGLQNAIEAAAEAIAPGKHVRMPSGAGHDAR